VKQILVVTVSAAALLSGIVGCSSSSEPETPASSKPSASAGASETGPTEPPVTAAAPDQAKVTFGDNDAGPVTGIGCVTENGRTTISVEGSQATTVVLTDEQTPTVNTVGIGEVGSDSPALLYQEGTSASPATATRDGQKYTVTGTGLGTTAADPMSPVDTPFEIAVTCP
jgi:lipoprotein LpqH